MFHSNADTNDFQFLNVNTIPTIGFGNTIGQDHPQHTLNTVTNRYTAGKNLQDFGMNNGGHGARPTTGVPTYTGYG
tara:strand:+ start:2824 stop:3051 length:228 start_codon:yes stop_codon:yes gene_type:complete